MTPERRRRTVDLAIAAVFALSAVALCYRAANWNSALYVRKQAADIWFDADVYRMYNLATTRAEFNDRGSLHPVWPYLTYPATTILVKYFGRWPESALRVIHALIAGLWAGGFFLLLRRFGLRRPDAAVFTVAAATTSSGIFWLTASETFALGSASMFPALALAAGKSASSARRHFWATAAAASVTITNWIAGFASASSALRPRKAIAVALGALALVVAAGRAQQLIYPQGVTAANTWDLNAPWIFALHSDGPFSILRTFFFSAVTAPEIRFLSNYQHRAWPLLSFQAAGLFTGTGWSWLATPAWMALLAFGAAALLRRDENPTLRAALGLTIGYQLLLHLLYGGETFLYSMHFVPLLVAAAALAAKTRWRPVVLALAVVMIVGNSFNNTRQFRWAKDYTGRYTALRAVRDRLNAMYGRPIDVDPSYTYRFWRDVLGWAPPLPDNWDDKISRDPTPND